MEKRNALLMILLLTIISGCSNSQSKISGRDYISQDLKACDGLRFRCTVGKEPFFDESGCGCMNITTAEKLCTDEKIKDCMGLNDPVCGWFDENIKCFRYPCAANFNNSCDACDNENVKSYTRGKCPE